MLAVAAAGGSATSFAPPKLKLDLRSSLSSFPLRHRQVSLRCCQVVSGDRSAVDSALELLKKSSGGRYTKEKSSIAVIGLNVHTTPVELREKLAMLEAQWPQAISELCSLNHIEEAAVLCMCNRIEIYVVALSQHRGVKEVTEWMAKTSGVPVSELCQHRFLLYNNDATEHLFEVAAGLDPLNLKEGQILAQVKHVVKVGQGVAGFDRKISGMFKQAISVEKRVRTETNIARARAIITEELNTFEAWKDSLETVPTIKKFRAYAERIRASEMDKCLSKTGGDGSKNKCALHDLSVGVVNKLLHGPMEHLRCGGSDDRALSVIVDNMHALDRMFELDTEMSVLEEKV